MILAYVFILFAIVVRFLPHPLAFTPVAAALLYFGARGPRRQLWVPLALICASDVVLTKVVYGFTFSWDHFVTWAWYAGVLWMGTKLGRHLSAVRIGGAAILSSVSFFLLSNLAVWACWDMYPRTLAGLGSCYAAGVPFFRNAVAGDLLFTAAMFAAPALAHAAAGALDKTQGRPAI